MSLEKLKQSRASTKKNITRIKNIVNDSLKPGGQALSPAEYKCRLGILESYFKQILSIQSEIEELDPEDNARGDLEDLYVTTKLSIQTQLGEDHNATLLDSTCIVQASSKLPQLKLPSFSGKYSEYRNFITSFKQIIDRELSLSNIEKFNHLRNCLHGQALEAVNAFQVTNENYSKALERLRARFDNPTLIFLENISSLFELPSVSKSNCVELRSLIDNASAIFGSLRSLGTEGEIAQAMLIYLVIHKADDDTKKKWKQSLDFKRLPSWENCTDVLERHCQYLESLTGNSASAPLTPTNSKGSRGHKQQKSHTFALSNSPCAVCSSGSHKIFNCDRFKSLTVIQRFEQVKRIGLCINCLTRGHQLSSCPSLQRCKICSRQHHSLLHRATSSSPESSNSLNQSPQPLSTPGLSATSSRATTHTHLKHSSFDQVILATAIVLVRDASGIYRQGRALLDSCSQANFITDEFSQRLLLPRSKHNIEICSIGQTSTNIKYKTTTCIKSRTTGVELPLAFCVTSNIAYESGLEIDISAWNIPSNIELADEQFYKSTRIDLLLGTETFFSLLSVGQIKLGDNLPVLQKTLLGWVVSGRYQSNSNNIRSLCMVACNDELDKKLEQLWRLEEVTSVGDMWTREEHSCERLYTNTVSRSQTGRIIVKLPFKDDPCCLGASYTTALRRFMSQERRLWQSPELGKQYAAFMEEYENLGHMSIVEEPNLNEPHYFIPHHCVLKPSSTSTKLRVVFDASCRTTSQRSLNDIQMIGPTLQRELVMLLLSFRLHRFALTADIVKMYRQVIISPEHRKFQYILWRKSSTDKISTYQLNTVTYGMAAAPYLAIRSLFYLADQYASQFKIGSNVIKSSFYVDDLLCGADSVAELFRIKHEVSELLKLGGFELAKWHSNHPELKVVGTVKDLKLDDSITSTLGIKWNQNCDSFLFTFEPKQRSNSRITKRYILSIASTLFDPLGLLAPVESNVDIVPTCKYCVDMDVQSPISSTKSNVSNDVINRLYNERLEWYKANRYEIFATDASIKEEISGIAA
ncbi:uncharacterized protein LOC118756475 [Rhagoletis pomonella]|uniref:uncharacterized protein LOC118756475 n=1 Tax=Rhagoletis pomonella TaxID=28610 RepID=UPI0017825F80|nr:uncharacterized protein LOC118756475 [Rhagoletis pomonella]